MSFRKYGGTQFASSHNIVKSNVNTTGSFYVTENVGQPNTYINFESDISGNMNIYGNLDVSGNISSSGNIDCSGNLVVTGNTDISGNLHVQKNIDCSGNIDVSGNVTAKYMFLTSGLNYTTATNGVVPKSYVDSVANGLTPLPPCILCKNDASFNSFPPSGYNYTIDGLTLNSSFDGSAVLINAQGTTPTTPAIANGVYIINSGPWTRAPYLTTNDKATGTATFILQGTTYANYRFVCTTGTNTSPAFIDVSAVLWTPFDIPFSLGQGLNKTIVNGNTVVQVDSSLNFIQYLDNSGNTLNIGNYTPTVNIGNNQAINSTLNLGASMTGGILTIGNNSTTTSSTVTNIANGAGQQGALNIGSVAGNGRAINIGNLSTGGVTTIQGATLTLNPQASGAFNLGSSMTAGSIQIGGTTGGTTAISIGNGTSQTGPITINRNGGGNTNINGWTIVGNNNILNASGDIQIDTTGGVGRGMYLGGSISNGAVWIANGNSQTGPIYLGNGTSAKTITIGSTASTVAINGATTVTGTTNITGTTTVTGTLTTTSDAVINSLPIGRGGGNISNNTAFGNSTLSTNTTGQNNTAIGFTSGRLNTTGGNNTAIGYQALENNTIGNNNTAIGESAGFKLSGTSSNNTFLGGQADVSSNTLIYNYSTALGYAAIIDASNQIVFGGSVPSVPYPSIKIPGSYVGIGGLYNPSSGYVLEVNGPISVGNTNFVHLSTGPGLKQRTLWMLYSGNSSPSDYGIIQVEDQGIAYRNLALNPNGGNVGIGTTTPQYLLDVSGNIRASNTLLLTNGSNQSSIYENGSNLNLINNNTGGNVVISNSAYTSNNFNFGFDSNGNTLTFNANGSSDTAFIRWYSPNDSNSYLQLGTTDNALLGAPEIIYFTQYEYTNTKTYVRMRIDGTGVWINPSGDTYFTTASTYSLNVNGSLITTSNATISGNTFTNSIQSSDPTANISIGTTLTTGDMIIGSTTSASQEVNINGTYITVGGSNTATLTLTPANVSTFNLGSNMTGGQILIGMNTTTASSQAVNINTGSLQTGQINLGTGASAKTITIGSAAATVAINGNFLISQTTLPPLSTTQLGYTFSSPASTIGLTNIFTNLVNITSVIAGVYTVTAQCDVNYTVAPTSSSWLRLSLNSGSSALFNANCAQDYFPPATSGNFYIRITGIFTLSSTSNISVGGVAIGGTLTNSTVLSYTRIG